MKSAYGRKTPAENIELTHVEQGSPMGEVLRRYWQPVCLASELGELPRRVRILAEDLVVFRTRNGEIGCLEPHCSHRGTSLEFGRVEEAGIRCCYHGWLYSPAGRVIEMPCEAEGVCDRMNVEHPAYPAMEFGGLVFVYMGPAGTEPLFPMLDILDTRGRDDVVLEGARLWGEHAIGYVSRCNWLQHFENVVDPWHVIMLHQAISGEQFEGAMMDGKAVDIRFDYTPLGVCYHLTKKLPNGNTFVRSAECMVPNVALIPDIRASGDVVGPAKQATEVTWVVPVDNEHCTALTIIARPAKNGIADASWRPGTDTAADIRPGTGWDRSYEQRQRRPDDREAQESQRPIAVHALESLAGSDGGVVRLRRVLREQVKRLADGLDPVNVFRDPAENRRVRTTASNVVLSSPVGQAEPLAHEA